MGVISVCICFRIAVSLLELILVLALGRSLDGLKQGIVPLEALSSDGVSTEDSSIKCTLQSTHRLPAFSIDGDFVIGGVFSLHYKLYTVIHQYTSKPEPLKCAGRLVRLTGIVKKC